MWPISPGVHGESYLIVGFPERSQMEKLWELGFDLPNEFFSNPAG